MSSQSSEFSQSQSQSQTLSRPSTSAQSSSSSPTGLDCTNEYFDVEDIFALSHRVKCRFERDVDNLGFLDPSLDSQHITRGVKVDLPLWLAKSLYSDGLITIETPKGYNETYREILKADANCVNLEKISPNYYKLGVHLAKMGLADSQEIINSLLSTFYQRLRRIIDNAAASASDFNQDMPHLTQNLDNTEIELFNVGRKSYEEYQKWENRSLEKITANEMVTKFKRRKRIIQDFGSS